MKTSDPLSAVSGRTIRIPGGKVFMEGELNVPQNACAIVLLAHGWGFGRHSPRNQLIVAAVRGTGVATLTFDLLTHAETGQGASTGKLGLDIELLAHRLIKVTRWLEKRLGKQRLTAGYCASGTGGAAALMAAAKLGDGIAAVVSWGSSTNLAGPTLPEVKSPTLLIVGGYDQTNLFLNEETYMKLRCVKDYRVVPGATPLFQEPGKLEQVAHFGANWFTQHLAAPGRTAQ